MVDYDPTYVTQLEETLAKFLQPIGEIPFPIAIKAITGYSVKRFDPGIHRNLLEALKKASEDAARQASFQGIVTRRPNEAGNKIEPFVMNTLRGRGLQAEKPRARSGRIKVMGYPDIRVKDGAGNLAYIDCKTYNRATAGQTMRTFYFSPSTDPKINDDALHLVITFELEAAQLATGGQRFAPTSWAICTLEDLKLDFKREFNANNVELYRSSALLARGEVV